MTHKPRIIIQEIVTHKASSMAIGMSIVALFGIPLLQNIAITLIITSLTLVKDYFLRKYFYKKALKRFEEEMTRDLKGLEDILKATDPYVSKVTIIDTSEDDDNNGFTARATDEELELQYIAPLESDYQHNLQDSKHSSNELQDGETIIMQLIGIPEKDDELTHIWKQSGKNGLRLVKKDDSSDEDS